MKTSDWLILLGMVALVCYCLGRIGEISARMKERHRKAKAYGGNPWDY